MAVLRSFQRRLLSLCLNHPPRLYPNSDPSRKFLSSASSLLRPYDFDRRGLQAQSELIASDGEEQRTPNSSESDNVPPQIDNSISAGAAKYSAVSSLKTSTRHDLAMIFTCGVCETRSVKTVCRESYEKGVVVAQCSGCDNLHLISDRLGWFGEPGSVEDFLAARGEEVKKGSVDSLSLTLEDLAGKKL